MKSDWNKKDAIGVPLYVNEVRGHVQGQVLSEVKLGGKCKICIMFWKVKKFNYNQTWFVDATCEPLTCCVGGHSLT